MTTPVFVILDPSTGRYWCGDFWGSDPKAFIKWISRNDCDSEMIRLNIPGLKIVAAEHEDNASQACDHEPITNSPGPWETWYNVDSDGVIQMAGIDAGGPDNRAYGIAEIKVLTENVCYDDKAKHNAAVIADTELLGAAEMLLALCTEAQEKLDVLAEDIADEFPGRSENAADLAMRIRAAITRTKRQPVLTPNIPTKGAK
jgi:hypothetical protein